MMRLLQIRHLLQQHQMRENSNFFFFFFLCFFTLFSWSTQEHVRFLKGLEVFGSNWKHVQYVVKTRSIGNIQAHANSFLNGKSRWEREQERRKQREAYTTSTWKSCGKRKKSSERWKDSCGSLKHQQRATKGRKGKQATNEYKRLVIIK